MPWHLSDRTLPEGVDPDPLERTVETAAELRELLAALPLPDDFPAYDFHSYYVLPLGSESPIAYFLSVGKYIDLYRCHRNSRLVTSYRPRSPSAVETCYTAYDGHEITLTPDRLFTREQGIELLVSLFSGHPLPEFATELDEMVG